MPKGKVFFRNKPIGTIEKTPQGDFQLSYQTKEKSVSWTLPSTQQNYASDELFPFFDGLIPEGWLLNLAHKNWKIPKDDRMSLLLVTCQDCIGATHIMSDQNIEPMPGQSKKHLHTYQSNQENSGRCMICLSDLSGDEFLYHKKCAQKLFGFAESPIIDISSEDLDQLALEQINQRLTLTGVQKKLSLSSVKDEKGQRLTVVGLDGRFILKPSIDTYPEMAENEHITMKIAAMQGLPMAECGMVYLSSGERAYITRRFDRIGDEKIQVEDFCQLSEKPTAKKYTGSCECLGKVLDRYSAQPQDDKVTLFQIVLFSFWVGNADMHLKNFSLWEDPNSKLVRKSPCYDFLNTRLLISAKDDNEELALPINGKKNKIQWKDFQAFGENLNISLKVMERIRDRMLDSYFDVCELIERSFLSENKKEEFIDLLSERSKRLVP